MYRRTWAPENGTGKLSEKEWLAIVSFLQLSGRETQILQRVFEGQKDLAIAMDLGISTHTVHTHFERMHRKLAVVDRCGLVVRVFEAYLVLQSRGLGRKEERPCRSAGHS